MCSWWWNTWYKHMSYFVPRKTLESTSMACLRIFCFCSCMCPNRHYISNKNPVAWIHIMRDSHELWLMHLQKLFRKWTKCCYVALPWSHAIFKSLPRFFQLGPITCNVIIDMAQEIPKRAHRVIIWDWDFASITSYYSTPTRPCIRRYRFVHDGSLNPCWPLPLRLTKSSGSRLTGRG